MVSWTQTRAAYWTILWNQPLASGFICIQRRNWRTKISGFYILVISNLPLFTEASSHTSIIITCVTLNKCWGEAEGQNTTPACRYLIIHHVGCWAVVGLCKLLFAKFTLGFIFNYLLAKCNITNDFYDMVRLTLGKLFICSFLGSSLQYQSSLFV